MVRYADDMVLGFQHRTEAERFLQDWRERLQKFELELHPDKTRLIEFGRFAAINRKQRGEGKPEIAGNIQLPGICVLPTYVAPRDIDGEMWEIRKTAET